MEDKKKNIRHVLNIIVILFITMLLVSGGTFAYLRWISSTDQQTGLAIQIEENINMHIENPLLTKAGMYPTNTCTNEAATMSGVSIIALENQTGVIARPKFKLRVKITDKDGNVITNNSAGTDNGNNPYRYFINYAVAEENGTCTEPLYSGNFDQNEPTYQGQTQWYDSEWITLMNDSTGFPTISDGPNTGVSFNGTPYQTTYHNYKVWVWIDESYTSVNIGNVVSDKLQDAKIELSWSENSTVQQIKAQAYAVFSSSEEGGDDSLRFYQSDEPITEDSTYAGRPVTNVYTGFETENYNDSAEIPWDNIRNNVKSVIVEDTIAPISTPWWFLEFRNCSYLDVTKLDTSNVTKMLFMFYYTGRDVTTFEVVGMENWNVSNVTNMSMMFSGIGDSASTLTIEGMENWDTSNVTDMQSMFSSVGKNATNEWSLDLSNWDVYKVTNAFNFENSNNITPPNWYTSYAVYSAQDSSLRFYRTQTDLTQQSTWNGLEVTTVYNGGNRADNQGFESLSYSSASDAPWNGSAQNIRRVVVENEIYPESTAYWFYGFEHTSDFNLAKLNTSSVTNMSYMFYNAGVYEPDISNNICNDVFNVESISNWDTSKVTNMSHMFENVGSTCILELNLDLSKWNVSNVTTFESMFMAAGNDSNVFNIGNLNGWNTSKATSLKNMFAGVQGGYDIGSDTTVFYIGDIGSWDVSNVTDMSGMFSVAGSFAETFTIGDLKNWNTSKVTNMNYMFDSAGYNDDNFKLDLRDWNVSKVMSHTYFNGSVEDKIKAPNFGS